MDSMAKRKRVEEAEHVEQLGALEPLIGEAQSVMAGQQWQ